MSDLAYHAASRFWAEVAGSGVVDVVVSPGSRSAPLAVTARNHPSLQVTVQLDERVGSFCALGMAKAQRRCVALVCTSGTAAANYLPAVIEAHHSNTPLLVCTADRPTELQDAGASQTIDQTKLYGNHVRWYTTVPCQYDNPDYFARLGVRAVTTANAEINPGPVHLNWPFRKPLEPQGPLLNPEPFLNKPIAPTQVAFTNEVEYITNLQTARGLIVAGTLNINEADAQTIAAFANATQWPILADAGSQLRGHSPLVLNGAKTLLQNPELTPEVLLKLGKPPNSQAMLQFVADCEAKHRVLVDPHRRWQDPAFSWTATLASHPVALLHQAATRIDATSTSTTQSAYTTFSAAWLSSAATTWQAIETVLNNGELHEPLLAATLLKSLPSEIPLYASNSMPARDIGSFWPPHAPPRQILMNRGVNGIDGMVASALGAALALSTPVVALIGDVALLHDVGGLLAACTAGVDLTIVVPNNNGGGIFSLLPVADCATEVYFDELFHTPHGINLGKLAAGVGANYRRVNSASELAEAVSQPAGVTVVEVPIDHHKALAQRKLLAELS